MSGHSHWSSIKHKKAVVDAKRGKLFSKLVKHIMIAARSGGGNPADNLRLRYAIDKARAEFMPKDSILRAIKKGTGELEGGEIAELTYEGMGPGGVSLILEIFTDNRNRTGSEIRGIVEKRGGSIGKAGSVAWKFDRAGVLELLVEKIGEDDLFEIVTEAGAQDLVVDGERYRITTQPEDLDKVRSSIEAEMERRNPKKEKVWGEEEDGAPLFVRQELAWLSKEELPLAGDKVKQVLDLMEALEDHDDVQAIWSDFSISEDAIPEEYRA